MALNLIKFQADLQAALGIQPDNASGQQVAAAVASVIDAYIKTMTITVKLDGLATAINVMPGNGLSSVSGTIVGDIT